MSDEPATKQDLAEAVRQMKQDQAEAVLQMNQNLAEAVRQVTDNLTEAIRDSQTEVLRAFYDWARPVDMRLRHSEDLAQRVVLLEERVANLERGKLMH